MITHILTDEPIIALTFDDGPHPEFTPRLLDILDRFDVRATFFMVGKAAAGHPDIVKRAAARHVIANHSWDHPLFPDISAEQRREQLRACDAAIAPYGRRFFRPPHGAESQESRADVEQLGYQSIGWSVDAEDWMPRDSGWMSERLLQQTTAGSIVLLHDAIFRSRQPVPQYNRAAMLEALTLFLERAGDLTFLTVPELLARERAGAK